MFSRIRAVARLAACVVVTLAAASPPCQADEPKPVDPKPPVLKQVRWQYLHKRYQDVCIDGSGRAWFLIRPFTASGEKKLPPCFLTCPELPKDHIEIPGKNAILGFDKRGRFWEVGPHGLCCTDVRTGKFKQYRPAPDVPKTLLPKSAGESGPHVPSFALTMLEHSSGRLYFVDSFGVHVLAGDKWSYHRFRPALKRNPRPDTWRWKYVRFVEGPGGLVYLWGGGEITSGFWVHDGTSWRHRSTGRLSIVAPLKNGYALVWSARQSRLIKVCQGDKLPNPSSQPSKIPAKPYLKWYRLAYMATGPRGETIVRTKWGKLNSIFVIRTDGTVVEAPPEVPASPKYHVCAMCPRLSGGRVALETQPFYTWDGEKYAPLFRKELYPHGRCLGTDRHGRVYTTVEGQRIGSGSKRLAVYDPRYPDDRPTLKYECFPLRQRRFREYAASMDSKGRLWARLRVSKYPFLSRYSNGRWTHFPDPTVRGAKLQVDAEDFAGRFTFYNYLWCMRSPTDGDELKGVPGMSNPAQLQPLADGCMIASESCQQRAFFFDGVTWTAYESLPKLVESQYTRLTKLVDNSAFWWRASNNRVALDSTGRIWVSWDENKHYARKSFRKVYDGKQWLDFPHGFAFLFDKSGKRCVLSKRLYDSSVWPPRELTALPSEVKVRFTDDWARAVHFDREGGLWAYTSLPAHCFRSDGWKKVRVRGRCILEDSAGRKWFHEGYSSLNIIGTDGKVSKRYEHGMRIQTPIVQQGENVFWAAAGDGLMSLQVVKGRIRVKKHYTGLVPRGRVHWMAIDAEGSLWMSTSNGSGLYRIEIPPLDKQKD